jgi:hypothetical protein
MKTLIIRSRRLEEKLKEIIQKIKESQLYSISTKFLSGIIKNLKLHMILKELKE